MNSKNIKKALNSKLNIWLESIDDNEVKKVIKENAIISGGALVSLLTGAEVNDYDVYFKTKEAVLTVSTYYVDKFNESHKTSAIIKDENGKIKIFIQSKGVAGEDDETEPVIPEETEQVAQEQQEKPKYRPVYLTSNAITLSDKIQIVIRFWGEVEEIHKNYDFAHCTCSWSSWDNNLVLPQKALECIINKELHYIGSKYPLCSIIRTRKFLERGYTINAGQYLKMCLQLNEFNLHDIEILKDQLVGVDSAYFNRAIEFMEKKQSEEPDFKIDNSYLFEVINRIF
ncbi:hypothetical protein [Anaerocolumna sp.]|uniref:hypothetical protein n=1 Tax=Anaerocolumna sp. TaxID=2041569 RepID=UPI0028A745E7|nr:hypothetical protein [Anaerocolumna sp.]